MDKLCTSINNLNKRGKAVIVCITGASSSGKTLVSRYLYSKYPFYQYIPLGLVSKALRYVLPLGKRNFEIGDNKFVNNSINDFLYKCITYYGKKGVNTIIDGTQCDTKYLSKNPYLSAGVVINATLKTRKKWGDRPKTHLNRRQCDEALNNRLVYFPTEKFVFVDNEEGSDIYARVKDVLERLLLRL